VASGVYFVNDACDLKADRMDPRKRERPIAAGIIVSVSRSVSAAP
jgi:decaprenyl-phosphate phosphoribosyltransferase